MQPRCLFQLTHAGSPSLSITHSPKKQQDKTACIICINSHLRNLLARSLCSALLCSISKILYCIGAGLIFASVPIHCTTMSAIASSQQQHRTSISCNSCILHPLASRTNMSSCPVALVSSLLSAFSADPPTSPQPPNSPLPHSIPAPPRSTLLSIFITPPADLLVASK